MDVSFEDFLERVEAIHARVRAACATANRDPGSVILLPVTKTHPAAAADFAGRAGLLRVGENRVQEALEKMDAADPSLQWELIGHLQSNKAKVAAARFARIQSVDSIKLIRHLDRAAGEAGRTLPILLQINAGRDPAKFGAELEEAPALLEAALAAPHLAVEGLMTIAPLSDSREVARRTFSTLRELRDTLKTDFAVPLPELSMGMTGDLEEAVAEGSTMIRVGTALYGTR